MDTIFEIGGQDSKYILLRNGVAIDYAMNAACSAGTGSFLEECAHGDLGLTATEIAAEALRAGTPVLFKATCAAFINSDIRTALQEGYSREDVTAGVVYAIVRNYLAKVKEHRAVGKKVFFQGGVALNRAVACAFAQCLDKAVIIPPHPELLGALGVGLLALERSPGAAPGGVDLNTLAAPAMSVMGEFTCHACGNHCTIERFEVAGRRFPFGGRCSRFENLAKGAPAADAADLVEQRNALIFASPTCHWPSHPLLPLATRGRIGIPRALSVHSLYPLYSTFFRRLGLEVVLSGVDPAGWLKAKSAFCFPVQIAHGAVLDLVRRAVQTIFLPHVMRMANPERSRDSYLCPVTQASPYFISKAFPGVDFLSPLLNFAQGYAACKEPVEMAVSRLGIPRPEAEAAWREAVAAQLQTEQAMRRLGADALAAAMEDGKPTVVLVGRSYNAFPPEASQSAARKLHSMGVRVIPGDCLPRQIAGPTAWHYPNIIMNAVDLAGRHANLFLLYISNFGCTIDAFLQTLISSQLGSKPYLTLEIDAHTADAGVQTRLEAFLEVIGSPRLGREKKQRFSPATIGADAMVTTSAGQRVPLTDPRVKLHFPNFSSYHAQAGALAHAWQGLERGTSGRTRPPSPGRGTPLYIGPGMPAAADLPRPDAPGAPPTGTGRNRRVLHGPRRRALRGRLLPGLLLAVHPRARIGRPLHLRSARREQLLRFEPP